MCDTGQKCFSTLVCLLCCIVTEWRLSTVVLIVDVVCRFSTFFTHDVAPLLVWHSVQFDISFVAVEHNMLLSDPVFVC